jgi:hypothetical protein
MPETFRLAIFLLSITAALWAQGGPDNRRELEQSLQSRYRPAVLGKGVLGIGGGENALRRAGGVVVLRRAGLWGSFDRRQTASWSIRGDRSELLAGRKDVELQSGEKFYVTSAIVGSDVVEIGLLTAGTVSGNGQTGRLWATAAFFFDPNVLAQGDMSTVDSALDQWLGQGGDSVSPPAAAPVVAAVHSETPAPRSELKVGMTRAQLVQAAGTPLSEVSFGERAWLTYPGLVAMLEQDKLVNVDRSLQPPSKVSVRSDPAGAEILLDGKFVGNTPGNLQLVPGTYNLSVRLQGYEPWQRELSVIPGSEAGVQAKLEAAATK